MHIFQTRTAHHAPEPAVLVTVATEAGRVLTVRDINGSLLMGLYVGHVTRGILASMFDDVDTDAILSRLAETN